MDNFQKLIQPKDHIAVSEVLKTSVIAEIGRYDANLSIDNELLDSALHSLFQMKEAETSSTIEGTRVTFQEVLMSDVFENKLKEKNERTDVDEVIGLHIAIERARQHLADDTVFSNKTIKIMNKAILERAKRDQGVPGEYRKEMEVQVRSYFPPKSKDLIRLMDDFEVYIQDREDNVNPLVKVAVAHAYFELIHPFGDGNGRTGRLLIPFLMYEYGMTQSPSLFLSSYFEKNRPEYYQRMDNLSRENGWNEWVEYFLKATNEHVCNLNKKAKSLFNLYRDPAFLAMSTADSQIIKNFIFRQPIFTAPLLARRVNKSQLYNTSNLNKKLNKLVEQGDLKILRQGKGRRLTWYSCPKIINIIERG